MRVEITLYNEWRALCDIAVGFCIGGVVCITLSFTPLPPMWEKTMLVLGIAACVTNLSVATYCRYRMRRAKRETMIVNGNLRRKADDDSLPPLS